MKYLLFIMFFFFIPEKVSPSKDKFDGLFLYEHNIMSKDQIIDKINSETRLLISEMELKLFFKKQPFKTVPE